MMNMDDFHFVSRNQKEQLNMNTHISPFIVNSRETMKEVDNLLKQMRLKLSFTWSYDPLGMRVEKKTTPYAHTSRSEI